MASNHNLGLCIWVGEDRFVTFNVDVRNPEIAATFNDIRSYMSYTVPTYTYALEFTREYKVYTVYRPVNDLQGRPSFLAVTVFVPYDVFLSEITSLLERISLSYYKNHYGFGGIFKQGVQLIPELYTRELDNVRTITDPDGSWVGRASFQTGKPKILPFSDLKVVEQFFQHPHRTSFHQCQEVLFVPQSYLNGTDSGISLPRSTPDDFFALDGADVSMETIGFQIEKAHNEYSIKDFQFNSIPQNYWVPFLRPNSVISFTLSKGKYYDDIPFEGPLKAAINKGYINDTLKGYSFSESVPFLLRKKVVTFVFPSLEQTSVFALTLIASGHQTKRQPILSGRAEITFSGEEIGTQWSFLIEENGYEYTLGQNIPDYMEDVWTDKGSRLYRISDQSGKDIRLDFGISSPVRMSKGASRRGLSGEWILPSTLSPDTFVLEHSKYFEKNITGIESGSVIISLDRIGYELCLPNAFWSSLNEEQRRDAAFKLDDSEWKFASSPEGGMIVVADQMKARDGQFSTYLKGRKLGFDFDTRTDENKDRFYIKPKFVELDVAADCNVALRNGINLSGTRVVVPQSEVGRDTFKAQGYTVQQIGREDNENGSFPRYCVTNRAGNPVKLYEIQYYFFDEKWKCSGLDEKKGFILTKQGMYLAYPFDLMKTKGHKKNKSFIIEEGRGDDGRPCYSVKMREQRGNTNQGQRERSSVSWLVYALLAIALLCISGVVVYFFMGGFGHKKTEKDRQIVFMLKGRPNDKIRKIHDRLKKEDLKIQQNTISYDFDTKNPLMIKVELHVDNEGVALFDTVLDIHNAAVKDTIYFNSQAMDSLNTLNRGNIEDVRKFIDKYPSDYIKNSLEPTLAAFKADSLLNDIYSMMCSYNLVNELDKLLGEQNERADSICAQLSALRGTDTINYAFLRDVIDFHTLVFDQSLDTCTRLKDRVTELSSPEQMLNVIEPYFKNKGNYKNVKFKSKTDTITYEIIAEEIRRINNNSNQNNVSKEEVSTHSEDPAKGLGKKGNK